MYLIDTNIFIELLLGQKNSNIALEVLSKLIIEKSEIIITSFTFHSIIVILERMKKENEIKLFCDIILSIDNLDIVHPSLDEEIKIINNRKTLKLDYDDSFQYISAKKNKAILLTFDKHFDKLKDITSINLTKTGGLA
jgi:uncharacterized protein